MIYWEFGPIAGQYAFWFDCIFDLNKIVWVERWKIPQDSAYTLGVMGIP